MESVNVRNLDDIQEEERGSRGTRLLSLLLASLAGAAIVTAGVVVSKKGGAAAKDTRDPLADAFDAPLWFNSSASRNTTTTPVQSLLLVNSAALRARGRAFASRLERERPDDVPAQIQLAYRLACGRGASPLEIERAMEFLTEQAANADPGRLASGQASFVPGRVPHRDGQAAYLEPESDQWAWWDLQDSIPAMGAIPTLKWIRGSFVRSPHRLTVNEAAPPEQELTGALTLYDAFTNRPLPILDDRIRDVNPWIPLCIARVGE